jgi:hypothetical protein
MIMTAVILLVIAVVVTTWWLRTRKSRSEADVRDPRFLLEGLACARVAPLAWFAALLAWYRRVAVGGCGVALGRYHGLCCRRSSIPAAGSHRMRTSNHEGLEE